MTTTAPESSPDPSDTEAVTVDSPSSADERVVIHLDARTRTTEQVEAPAEVRTSASEMTPAEDVLHDVAQPWQADPVFSDPIGFKPWDWPLNFFALLGGANLRMLPKAERRTFAITGTFMLIPAAQAFFAAAYWPTLGGQTRHPVWPLGAAGAAVFLLADFWLVSYADPGRIDEPAADASVGTRLRYMARIRGSALVKLAMRLALTAVLITTVLHPVLLLWMAPALNKALVEDVRSTALRSYSVPALAREESRLNTEIAGVSAKLRWIQLRLDMADHVKNATIRERHQQFARQYRDQTKPGLEKTQQSLEASLRTTRQLLHSPPLRERAIAQVIDRSRIRPRIEHNDITIAERELALERLMHPGPDSAAVLAATTPAEVTRALALQDKQAQGVRDDRRNLILIMLAIDLLVVGNKLVRRTAHDARLKTASRSDLLALAQADLAGTHKLIEYRKDLRADRQVREALRGTRKLQGVPLDLAGVGPVSPDPSPVLDVQDLRPAYGAGVATTADAAAFEESDESPVPVWHPDEPTTSLELPRDWPSLGNGSAVPPLWDRDLVPASAAIDVLPGDGRQPEPCFRRYGDYVAKERMSRSPSGALMYGGCRHDDATIEVVLKMVPLDERTEHEVRAALREVTAEGGVRKFLRGWLLRAHDVDPAVEQNLREVLAQPDRPSKYVRQLLDYGVTDGYLYVVMPRYRPGDLADWLLHHPVRSADACVAIVADVIAGAVAMESLANLDFKPANILLNGPPGSQPGRGMDAIVSDWGVSALIDALARGITRPSRGTDYYSAPEQIQVNQFGKNVPLNGHLMDARAQGAVLYEALTGEPPHKAEVDSHARRGAVLSPREHARQLCEAVPPVASRLKNGDQLPVELCSFVDRLLSVDPAARVPVGPGTVPERLSQEIEDLRRTFDLHQIQVGPEFALTPGEGERSDVIRELQLADDATRMDEEAVARHQRKPRRRRETARGIVSGPHTGTRNTDKSPNASPKISKSARAGRQRLDAGLALPDGASTPVAGRSNPDPLSSAAVNAPDPGLPLRDSSEHEQPSAPCPPTPTTRQIHLVRSPAGPKHRHGPPPILGHGPAGYPDWTVPPLL